MVMVVVVLVKLSLGGLALQPLFQMSVQPLVGMVEKLVLKFVTMEVPQTQSIVNLIVQVLSQDLFAQVEMLLVLQFVNQFVETTLFHMMRNVKMVTLYQMMVVLINVFLSLDIHAQVLLLKLALAFAEMECSRLGKFVTMEMQEILKDV